MCTFSTVLNTTLHCLGRGTFKDLRTSSSARPLCSLLSTRDTRLIVLLLQLGSCWGSMLSSQNIACAWQHGWQHPLSASSAPSRMVPPKLSSDVSKCLLVMKNSAWIATVSHTWGVNKIYEYLHFLKSITVKDLSR